MATKETICDNAFVLIGQTPLQSLAEESDKAVACNTRYNSLKLSLLGGHRWNFTIRRKQLDREAEIPVMRYKFQYTLPADNLLDGLLAAYPAATSKSTILDFVIQEGKLFTDRLEVWAEYRTSDVTEADFPHYFSELFIHHLALDLALILTDEPALLASLEQRTAVKERLARTLDSQAAPPNNVFTNFPLVRSRLDGVPSP